MCRSQGLCNWPAAGGAHAPSAATTSCIAARSPRSRPGRGEDPALIAATSLSEVVSSEGRSSLSVCGTGVGIRPAARSSQSASAWRAATRRFRRFGCDPRRRRRGRSAPGRRPTPRPGPRLARAACASPVWALIRLISCSHSRAAASTCSAVRAPARAARNVACASSFASRTARIGPPRRRAPSRSRARHRPVGQSDAPRAPRRPGRAPGSRGSHRSSAR